MTDLTAVNPSAATEAATLAQTDFFLASVGGLTRKVSPQTAGAAIGLDVYSAEVSAAQAALAAQAAGAPLYTTMPTISGAIQSPFMLQTTAGVKVYTHDNVTATFAGWLGEVLFDDVPTLLAYTGDALTVGSIVRTRKEGFAYTVVSSGEHVTTAGGDKLVVSMTPAGEFTARQCGAVEGADITAAVQLAVNLAAGYYSNTPTQGRALIDVRAGTLSETIHLGYGAAFTGVSVRGLGLRYAPNGYGTTLTTTMTNRPVFSVTAARSVMITDMYLVGPATTDLTADIDDPDITNVVATPWDAALTSSGVTPGRRYAPHAAIAIDPYAGTRPGTSYPDVTPPASIASGFTQYGKNGSSNTIIERVFIEGYEVGIVQTPSNWASNGDYVKISDCFFRYLKYAVSYGNTQARNVSIRRCNFSFVFCAFTNKQHGQQTGTFSGAVQDCGGNVTTLFDFTTVYSSQFSMRNCDFELLYRIGDLGGGASDIGSILFDNCSFDFCHISQQIAPPNVLAATGGNHHVYFRNGEISGYYSVFSFLNVIAKMDGTRLIWRDTLDKAYEQIGVNALGGGLALNFFKFDAQQMIHTPFNLDTATQDAPSLCGGLANNLTGRPYCVPIYAAVASRQAGYLRRTTTLTPRPFLYNDDDAATLHSGVSRSARAYTFTTTGITGQKIFDQQRGYMPGDIIQDVNTGTILFIRSTNLGTGQIIAELQNNYYWDGSAYQLVDTSFNLTSGTIRTICGRVYAAPEPFKASITSGSPTITVTAGPSVSTDYGLAIADFLCVDALDCVTFAGSNDLEVTAINTGAGTITMNGNADATIAGLNLDWWIRAAPGNEASR